MDTSIPSGFKMLFYLSCRAIQIRESVLSHLFIIVLPLVFSIHTNFALFKLFANQGNKYFVMYVANFS